MIRAGASGGSLDLEALTLPFSSFFAIRWNALFLDICYAPKDSGSADGLAFGAYLDCVIPTGVSVDCSSATPIQVVAHVGI